MTNTPLAVAETAEQPFTGKVIININDGSSTGADDGDTAGSQTFSVPAGKRLIIQTVSFYRGGTFASGSGAQIFVNCETNGVYNAYSVPPAIAAGGLFPGSTASETFEADAGTSVLVNAFRTTTAGNENETITVSGYLVNAS